MLALYGHPFSSYTWKVLIALYAYEIPFEFRTVGPQDPEHGAFLTAHGGPWAKFPLLVDGDTILFESTVIIEYLARHSAGAAALVPDQPDAAIKLRMLDRVFDNYVMAPMQAVVDEYLRPEDQRDLSRCDRAREQLDKSYRWLEAWREHAPASDLVTMIECAAAPSLHYADLVQPIGEAQPQLRNWLERLKALPPVRRCIDEAEPWQAYFPVPLVQQTGG